MGITAMNITLMIGVLANSFTDLVLLMQSSALNVTLVIGVMVNGFAGLLLLLQSFYEHDHPTYRRALMFTAIAVWLFAIGFALHIHFHWRAENPMFASALTLTYFHLGGMFFSWSHIGLVDPYYVSWRVCLRDLLIVAVAIPCYWLGTESLPVNIIGYVICTLHCSWFATCFYWKYYHMRSHLPEVTNDPNIRLRTRFIVVSCHLIIGFGIGGIVITSLLSDNRHAEWPFVLLMVASSIVFSYIAATLLAYHEVVEQTGNAIEDVAESKRNPTYAKRIHRAIGR